MLRKNRFSTLSLSDGYAKKTSRGRYKELMETFPNTLILFSRNGYYYGFDETAAAMSELFGSHYREDQGMLVARSRKKSELTARFRGRGLRYIIDEDGALTFEDGKGFKLPRPLSYYYEQIDQKKRLVKNKSSSWTESTSMRDRYRGDDAWTPGLPSARFYRGKR